MPTYKVTDPNTGQSLRLTGDSAPTEQELEEIFAAQAPKRTAVDTAVDVAKGFGKGAADTITAGTGVAGLINSMAQKTFGKTAALPEDNGSDEFLKQFEATNTPQMVGKGMQFAAEIAGPAAFSKVSKFLAARKATKAAQGAAALDTARKAGPRLVKKTPLDTVLGDALTDAAKTDMPTKATLPVRGDITAAGRPAITASGYDELIEGAGKVKSPLTGGPHPAPSSAKGAKIAEVDKGADELEQLLDAIHGADRPTLGNGGAKAVGEAADKLASSGKVEQAAAGIEKQVKLSVNELARAMRDRYGSARAGKMLQPNQPAKVGAAAVKRLAPGPSKMPEIVKEAIRDTSGLADKPNPGYATTLQRYASEGGIGKTAVVGSLAGASAGAAVGGTQGETTEDHIKNAAIGAGVGAIAVPLVAHAAAIGAPKALQNYIYTSLLSSPSSIAKAYLGGVGGAVMAAEEKMAAGQVREGAAIIQRLFSPAHIGDMVKGFRHPGALKSKQHLTEGAAENADTILGRLFDAANAPAVNAMRAGGVATDEAWRYTLSGTPTTELGKGIIELWSRHFPLKLATSLFPRVGVQVIERGLERSPLGLLGKGGLNEGVSAAGRATRAAQGAGAALAAYEGAESVPDWGKPYLIALSNVYALPVAMGLGAGKARAKGKGVSDQVTAALDQFSQNAPFPRYGTTESLKQLATGATLVPNAVRDVAVARDPYERKTDMKSAGFFGRTKAKIPGLRETLPVKGRQVNIAGKPSEDRSTPLKRVLSPAPRESEPLKGVPDKVATEIQRLDISINKPSLNPYRQDKTLGGMKIPPDLLEKAREERRQFLIPQLEKIVNGPAYDRADDSKRKRMLAAVIQRAEEAGNQRARANVIRVLRQQGAFKK